MKQFVLIIGAWLITLNGYSISGKSFMEKIAENYRALSSLELKIDYTLFKGYTGTDVFEQYSSVYRKDEQQTYRQIQQSELINTQNYFLNINHKEKEIIVSNPTEINPVDLDVKKSLKFCNNVIVEEGETQSVVKLIMKSDIDLPYSAIVITVDKNYWINEITFYYSSQIDFSTNYFEKDLSHPKLVVTYRELRKKWKDKEGLLNTGRFFEMETPELKLTETYTDYHLIDLRTS